MINLNEIRGEKNDKKMFKKSKEVKNENNRVSERQL